MIEHPFYELIDNATGKTVTFPWHTKDFRGDPMTVIGFQPPRHSNSTGRVLTKDGGEYFPGVVNASIR